MSWPLSQDYNEAVQNPRLNFADAELKQGVPATNPLGLPVVASGNFADVYRLACGGKSYAVKCFTREVAGRHDRYRAISAHLQQAKLSFTVDFQYLDQGIKVGGTWYPVLKMQWIEGVTLNQFVKEKLDKPKMLEALIQLWLQMARQLRDAQVAHADLQHGNVKLVPSSDGNKTLLVRLLDYDGMHIPALAKQPSGEVGHPSFQHPSRLRNNLYNADVDRFPHLVICTAIRALIVGGRPLWDRHDNGDNLLFRQTDFASPDQSMLLRELWQISDPVVRTLAGRLVLAARGPLGQEPLISELLGNGPPDPLTPAQVQQINAVFSSGGAKAAATTSLPTARKPLAPAKRNTPVPAWAVPTPIASTVTVRPTLAPPQPMVSKIVRQLRRPVPLFAVAIGLGLVLFLGFLGFLLVQLGGGREPTPIATANIPAAPQTTTLPPVNPTPSTLPSVKSTPSPLSPNIQDADALAAFSDLKLGDKFTNSIGQEFVYLPPGTFEMGSPKTEEGRQSDEGENGTHTVTLTEGFFMAIHETAQEQYEKISGEAPWKGKAYVREGADYPATYVSWDDANDKFIKRLNETLPPGWEYRLPTEAQWEYAARAGTQTRYSFGDDESQLGEYAWFEANAWDIGEQYAHSVGKKKPNEWGLYDMMGNVWEWTADLYGDYPSGKVTNPTGALGGSARVYRGGSFFIVFVSSYCRVAYRDGNSSGDRDRSLGFRLALVQVSSK